MVHPFQPSRYNVALRLRGIWLQRLPVVAPKSFSKYAHEYWGTCQLAANIYSPVVLLYSTIRYTTSAA